MSNLNKPLQYNTKTEMIYQMLREAIVSGELKPGERIVLRKIANDLGVSPIPVREAIKQLEAEQLVEVTAHSDVVITKLSEKDFRELSSIRVLLEAYATRLAAERANKEFMDDLYDQIKEMEDCVQNNDFRHFGVLNREFHKTIYSFSGNEQLNKLIESIIVRTDRARALFTYNPKRVKDSLNEHKEIVRAIEEQNSSLAEKIVGEQTWSTLKEFLEYTKQNHPENIKNE